VSTDATRTFLFTDIEGSTSLWERYPDAMGRALALHDERASKAAEQFGGRVFKSVGDAACCVFPTTQAAAEAALEFQKWLAKTTFDEIGPLRVRMGIHPGEANERKGDFFGPTLNRVARVMDLAHGGQVLLSRAAVESLKNQLPEGTRLIDMGVYPLKGLGQPEHVHQLAHRELQSDFPPLRSKAVIRNNLPAEMSTFVGRQADLTRMGALLKSSRLVTIRGSGGAGKTRLALRVARDLLKDFPDGAWFVDLSTVTDKSLVPQTVAEIMGVGRQGVFASRDLWLEQLVDDVHAKKLLLVLDNCEHLLDACAELANTLLPGAPDVRILATSREPLSVDGEALLVLESLALPEKGPVTVTQLNTYDSVRLFTERATAHHAGFKLNEANADAVAAICRGLEGIPLALELAAARLEGSPLESVAEEVGQRLSFLGSTNRSKQKRHRSLRDMLAWSEELLSDSERRLFHRVSVFRGGFTLEAAESICTGGGLPREELAGLLEQLVRKSLVRLVRSAGEARYVLLASVRDYAEERRISTGDEEVLARHCDYFVELAEESEQPLRGEQQTRWLDALEAEADDMRAAFEWAVRNQQAERILRATGALWYFWFIRGHLTEGRRWLERALDVAERVTVDDRLRAKAIFAQGLLTIFEDPLHAPRHLEESLRLARQREDRHLEATALFGLGWQAAYVGDFPRMRSQLIESRSLFATLRNPWGCGFAGTFLAIAVGAHEEHDKAKQIAQEAIESFQLSGDGLAVACARINFGEILRASGQLSEAAQIYEEALVACEDRGDRTGAALAAGNLGMTLCQIGEPGRARDLLKRALVFAYEGCRVMTSPSLAGLGGIAVLEGALSEAAVLLGAAEVAAQENGELLNPADRIFYDKQVATLKAKLEPAEMSRLWTQGTSLGLKKAVRWALREDSPIRLVVSN
jgi:predicted ATPase/class 3 adenylate cyclase